jgi:hypothetical protein
MFYRYARKIIGSGKEKQEEGKEGEKRGERISAEFSKLAFGKVRWKVRWMSFLLAYVCFVSQDTTFGTIPHYMRGDINHHTGEESHPCPIHLMESRDFPNFYLILTVLDACVC